MLSLLHFGEHQGGAQNADSYPGDSIKVQFWSTKTPILGAKVRSWPPGIGSFIGGGNWWFHDFSIMCTMKMLSEAFDLAQCVQWKCFGGRWLHKIVCLADLMLICFPCYTLVSTRGPHRMRIASQVTRSRCNFGAHKLKLGVPEWGHYH